jgi:molecular chaperone DnaK
VFSTAGDNQQAVTIRVFQGERELAADNKLLGEFNLVGIAPAPRGVPQVEVTFDIDANGIVNVSAKDKGTGKEQQIRIQASGGLNEAEIEKMVREAEAHAEEDKKRRALIEARNQGESLIHSTEKSLAEHGDRLKADDRAAIQSAFAELRAAMEGDDAERIETKARALAQVSAKLGEAIYQAQAGNGGGQRVSSNDTRDDVVDAEFEEVDDPKRASKRASSSSRRPIHAKPRRSGAPGGF